MLYFKHFFGVGRNSLYLFLLCDYRLSLIQSLSKLKLYVSHSIFTFSIDALMYRIMYLKIISVLSSKFLTTALYTAGASCILFLVSSNTFVGSDYFFSQKLCLIVPFNFWDQISDLHHRKTKRFFFCQTRVRRFNS